MRRIANLLALPAAALLGAAVALQWKSSTDEAKPAPETHEVLDLALQRTTWAEAEKWALDNGGSCTSGQKALRCSGVLDLEPVTLGFDAEDRLAVVDFAVALPDPEQAAELFAEKAEQLEDRLGK